MERILGRGGMALVYRVRRMSDDAVFAVKVPWKTRSLDSEQSAHLLRELGTCLDLPDHPHLVGCRFVRTLEGRPAIFTECVEGGTLESWITDRRLDGPAEVLDVAIQVARGLDAAHRAGVVHGDVKPSNVLMTVAGAAKLTDFGLARIWRLLEATPSEDHPGGFTAGYCAPELARGSPADPRSDIWSLGVTVLEMLLGEAPWQHGPAAGRWLERALCAEPLPEPLSSPELIGPIRRCLQEPPAGRWASVTELIRALTEAYRALTGRPYPYAEPDRSNELERSGAALRAPFERWRVSGDHWEDPRLWLERALRAAGEDPTQARDMVPGIEGSPRVQALADLEVFQQAEKIYQVLIAMGGEPLRIDLACLLQEKAQVKESLDDLPGAQTEYDRAAGLLERALATSGDDACAHELARCYARKAHCLWLGGESRTAVSIYDEAIDIWEWLVEDRGRSDDLTSLAWAVMHRANALSRTDRREEAVPEYDRGLRIWTEGVQGSDAASVRGPALARMNQAATLNDLGRLERASEVGRAAVDELRKLVRGEEKELANDLARACMNLAIIAFRLERREEVSPLFEEAVALREELVEGGREELADDLALAYMNHGSFLNYLGEHDRAEERYQQAARIWERRYHRDGRADLALQLARLTLNIARSRGARGDSRRELEQLDRSLEWLRAVPAESPRTARLALQTQIELRRIEVLEALERTEEALRACDAALALMEDEDQAGDPVDPERLTELRQRRERLRENAKR